MQSVILHDVIGKRVAALQQIRKGLNILGFLDVLTENPQLFEVFFIHDEKALSSDLLIEKLKFDESKELNKGTHNFLIKFLLESCCDNLEKFLVFTTGCRALPQGKIVVKYTAGSSFFASTCLFELHVPTGIQDYAYFKICLDSMLLGSGKAFTSV